MVRVTLPPLLLCREWGLFFGISTGLCCIDAGGFTLRTL
jgi:hypothetical protein